MEAVSSKSQPSSLLQILHSIQQNLKLQNSTVLTRYYCLARLTRFLSEDCGPNSISFNNLFEGQEALRCMCQSLCTEFQGTNLAAIFHSSLWALDIVENQYKASSKYFELFNCWVDFYQEQVSQPQNYDRVFVLLAEFLSNSTQSFYERVVFIEQVYDDLRGAIKYKYFWEDQNSALALQSQIAELHEAPPLQSYQCLLQVLSLLVYRKQVIHNQELFENSLLASLNQQKNSCLKFEHFVYRSLLYLFSNEKLVSSKPRQICRISLAFTLLSTHNDFVVEIVSRVFTSIPKMVRFALMHQFQEVYNVLEHLGKFQLVEELDKLPDYRELILKQVDKTFADRDDMAYEHSEIVVARGSSHKIYFQVTKPRSLAYLEFFVDSDVTVKLCFEGNLEPTFGSQTEISSSGCKSPHVYLTEQKQTSRAYQFQINDCGLHSVEFDNSYSWLNSKTIQYNIKVFRPAVGPNHSFSGLTFSLLDKYTKWVGFTGVVLTKEQQEFGDIWEDYLPVKLDMICIGQKVFTQGRIKSLKKLNWQRYQQCLQNVLIIGKKQRYQQFVNKLRESSPNVTITFKKQL